MTTFVGSPVFQIDVSGVRELAQDFGGAQAQKIVMDELLTAGQKSGKIVRDQGNRLIRKRTGKLAGGAKVDTTLSAHQIDTIVWWSAKSPRGFDYAPAVNYGRGPVVAKRAKALRFEIDGKILFRKRVGPARAQFFAEKGLQASETRIVAEHQRAVDRMVPRLEAM